MKQCLVRFSVAAAFIFSCLSYAQDNAADVQVPVADCQSSTINQILPQALSDLLVRMSGNASVMSLASLQNQTRDANRFVSSYQCVANQEGADQAWLAQIHFDGPAIKKLLQANGQALWSLDNHPKTLLWFSVPQADQAGVLASADNSTLTKALAATAQTRGLPILLPEMDLQDQASIPSDAAACPSDVALQVETARYGVKNALAVAVVPDDTNNSLVANWKLWSNGNSATWQSSGPDLQKILQTGLDAAIDRMAGHMATLQNTDLQATVLLYVTGVNNLTDYSAVLAQLKKLDLVSDVKVTDMSQNSLLLQVAVAGDTAALQRALNSLSQFSAQTTTTANADLAYRYNLG